MPPRSRPPPQAQRGPRPRSRRPARGRSPAQRGVNRVAAPAGRARALEHDVGAHQRAAGAQHARRLAEERAPRGEMEHGLDAQHAVDARLRERQAAGVGERPFEAVAAARLELAADRELARVDVHAQQRMPACRSLTPAGCRRSRSPRRARAGRRRARPCRAAPRPAAPARGGNPLRRARPAAARRPSARGARGARPPRGGTPR